MRIEETFTLQAPRDEVFAFLSDVERVAGCVPGVENLTPTADGGWEADLKAQLGPIKAAFRGRVALTATPPGRLEAAGDGQDRSSGSRAQVTFVADVTPLDGRRTQVEAVADLTIRGRLGQFGTGVIRATATELIRDFVTCADASLQRGPDAAGSGSAPLPAAGAAGGAMATVALVLRIVVRTLGNAVRAVWQRVRAGRRG